MTMLVDNKMSLTFTKNNTVLFSFKIVKIFNWMNSLWIIQVPQENLEDLYFFFLDKSFDKDILICFISYASTT